MQLTQGLHRSAQQTPHDVMTVCGDRRKTFAEVRERVSRLAGALQRLGIGKDDRVAILSLNSDRYHEYLLAVPWADAVVNPINTRWSPVEIAHCLSDSDSRVLLVDDAFASLATSVAEALPELRHLIYCGDGTTPPGMLSYEGLIAESKAIPDAQRGGDAVAGLFYTGGTTGASKGVMLSHANLLVSAMGSAATGYLVRPGAHYLHAAPMFHVADLAGWCSVMLLGGSHVMIRAFEPTAVLSAIERHQVTDVLLVPLMIQAIVDSPALGDYDLSSLRSLLYGASPIAEAVLERAMKAFPNALFTQAYGMTELAPVATLLSPDDHRRDDLLRSAGRAAPHCEVRIVDGEDAEVPRGTVGEIVVRGPQVMLGYWNKPSETAEAVRNGWMHTGDGGYMDDQGYVFIADRIKDMIVTGAENVYSVEVERAIARHPAVAQCAVIGVPDPDWGERVHAVVVLKPGEHAVGDEDLRAHVKTLIAGYKAPRSWEFVDALPVSGAGKVLKRELRRDYWGDAARQVN